MKVLHAIAFVLLVVGGLNWLLWGLFQWEVGMVLGGTEGWLARAVYILVGLSAVYLVVTHKKDCRNCVAPSGGQAGGAQM